MNDLNKYRKQIDKIDDKLLKLFSQRMEVVKKVGEYKKKNNLKVKDAKREKIIIQNKISQAKELNLSESFIKKIWKAFFQEAYEIEK